MSKQTICKHCRITGDSRFDDGEPVSLSAFVFMDSNRKKRHRATILCQRCLPRYINSEDGKPTDRQNKLL